MLRVADRRSLSVLLPLALFNNTDLQTCPLLWPLTAQLLNRQSSKETVRRRRSAQRPLSTLRICHVEGACCQWCQWFAIAGVREGRGGVAVSTGVWGSIPAASPRPHAGVGVRRHGAWVMGGRRCPIPRGRDAAILGTVRVHGQEFVGVGGGAGLLATPSRRLGMGNEIRLAGR